MVKLSWRCWHGRITSHDTFSLDALSTDSEQSFILNISRSCECSGFHCRFLVPWITGFLKRHRRRRVTGRLESVREKSSWDSWPAKKKENGSRRPMVERRGKTEGYHTHLSSVAPVWSARYQNKMQTGKRQNGSPTPFTYQHTWHIVSAIDGWNSVLSKYFSPPPAGYT